MNRHTSIYHRGGGDAFEANKNALEAEYRAEVKRLQTEDGELVIENEIRKEAIRPFSIVEWTLNGSLLDDDGAKPWSAVFLNVACSAAYYREHDRVHIFDDVLAHRIKHLINAEPLSWDIGWSGRYLIVKASGQIASRFSGLCRLEAGNATEGSKGVAHCASRAGPAWRAFRTLVGQLTRRTCEHV